MSAPQWKHFEHGADIGVYGNGTTVTETFIQAALALTAVITDLDGVAANTKLEIECEAPDVELLFVDWLNALIYEMAIRNMLFSRFEIELTANHLHAFIWGEELDQNKHRPAVEVKGATYTALNVSQDKDGIWSAQTIVDV